MNKYLTNLNRIEFVVTMACTGHCKHCSEGEHTAKGECIDGDMAARAVCEVCENYNIRSLMTFGGEPLLYPEVVCKIHEAGKKMNIPKREIITNGYFSKDEKRINEVAHMIAESGVNHILLSVDAFHQETIPIDHVKEFAKSIMREGIFIKTHPAWLVSVEDNNPYNLRTKEIVNEFSLLGINCSDGNIIFPSGNAKRHLKEYFMNDEEFIDPYEDDPKDIRAISFSPNGDVLNGNIYKKSILNILNSYSADTQVDF